MLQRALHAIVVLGGAAVTAVFLYWLTIEAVGFSHRDVFQWVLIAAGLIGVAYIAAPLPKTQ